jgi:hypothetical protein
MNWSTSLYDLAMQAIDFPTQTQGLPLAGPAESSTQQIRDLLGSTKQAEPL